MTKQWYAFTTKAKFGNFEAGETGFVRDLKFTHQLSVGPCVVMFSPKKGKSVRVAESVGLHTIYRLHTNPVPDDRNAKIEKAYSKYLEKNPVTPRHKKSVCSRVAELSATSSTTGGVKPPPSLIRRRL